MIVVVKKKKRSNYYFLKEFKEYLNRGYGRGKGKHSNKERSVEKHFTCATEYDSKQRRKRRG